MPFPTQVTPFSRWERELPKLLPDSRYKAIDKPKERRQIFDDFCKNVAEEQKRSKQRKEQQQAAAEPAFLALLNEAQAWVEDPPRAVTPSTPPPLPAEGTLRLQRIRFVMYCACQPSACVTTIAGCGNAQDIDVLSCHASLFCLEGSWR